MSHDIQQWIAEIKTLQQQLAEMQRDRDTALESAANWRQHYNTEAQQRRDEAKLSHQMIEALKAEIQQLRAEDARRLDEATEAFALPPEVEQLQSVEELKAKLVQAMIERDRWIQSLKVEKEAHAQTRRTLTNALGDTIDVLVAKERSATPAAAKATQPTAPAPEALPAAEQTPPGLPESSQPVVSLPEPKTPSLKLPPTRPAPPRIF